jgi:hypothetical protein
LFLIFAFVIVFGFILVFVTCDSLATNKRLPDFTPLNFLKIEITSHRNGDYVYPSSELTIKGTSSDTGKTNCTIYTSINNVQPFQNASAAGPQGKQDFSNWNSTFFNATNLITLGENKITSLIVCLDANSNTPTSSSHIINLTGLSSGDGSQSNSSFVFSEMHDNLENKIDEQHKSTEQSRMNLQNMPYAKSISPNSDHSRSQTQSTRSPNSGQSTIENP